MANKSINENIDTDFVVFSHEPPKARALIMADLFRIFVDSDENSKNMDIGAEFFNSLHSDRDGAEFSYMFFEKIASFDSDRNLKYFAGPPPEIRKTVRNLINLCSPGNESSRKIIINQKLVISDPELLCKVISESTSQDEIRTLLDDAMRLGYFQSETQGHNNALAILNEFGKEALIDVVVEYIRSKEAEGKYNSQYDDVGIGSLTNILKAMGEDDFLIPKILHKLNERNNLLIEFVASIMESQEDIEYPQIVSLYADNIGLFLERLGLESLTSNHLNAIARVSKEDQVCKAISKACSTDPFGGTNAYALIGITFGFDALVKCAPGLPPKHAVTVYQLMADQGFELPSREFVKAYPKTKHQILSNELGL